VRSDVSHDHCARTNDCSFSNSYALFNASAGADKTILSKVDVGGGAHSRTNLRAIIYNTVMIDRAGGIQDAASSNSCIRMHDCTRHYDCGVPNYARRRDHGRRVDKRRERETECKSISAKLHAFFVSALCYEYCASGVFATRVQVCEIRKRQRLAIYALIGTTALIDETGNHKAHTFGNFGTYAAISAGTNDVYVVTNVALSLHYSTLAPSSATISSGKNDVRLPIDDIDC
jgi:hypothetical protein